MASEFYEKLAVAMERQYQCYEPYRTLCDTEGVTLQDIQAMIQGRELHRIPTIPADWFKKNKGKGLFKELANLQKTGCWLVSSSTSGDSSYTWRTETDIQCVRDSFTWAYQKAPSCKAMAFMPSISFLHKVGQRFAVDDRPITFYAIIPTQAADKVFKNMDFMAQLNTPRTVWTMLKTRGKGRPVLDVQEGLLKRVIGDAEQNNTQMVLAVSVLMLYPLLKGLPKNYQLGVNAYFVTGAGGWDGKKGTTQGNAIVKSIFVKDMCDKFGIPQSAVETNFWDIYGTTENGKAQAGSYVQEYQDFVFEVGDDVRLYVINPVNGQPAAIGEQGYPRFVSPYGVEGCAGACVQQNDIVTVGRHRMCL